MVSACERGQVLGGLNDIGGADQSDDIESLAYSPAFSQRCCAAWGPERSLDPDEELDIGRAVCISLLLCTRGISNRHHDLWDHGSQLLLRPLAGWPTAQRPSEPSDTQAAGQRRLGGDEHQLPRTHGAIMPRARLPTREIAVNELSGDL